MEERRWKENRKKKEEEEEEISLQRNEGARVISGLNVQRAQRYAARCTLVFSPSFHPLHPFLAEASNRAQQEMAER